MVQIFLPFLCLYTQRETNFFPTGHPVYILFNKLKSSLKISVDFFSVIKYFHNIFCNRCVFFLMDATFGLNNPLFLGGLVAFLSIIYRWIFLWKVDFRETYAFSSFKHKFLLKLFDIILMNSLIEVYFTKSEAHVS